MLSTALPTEFSYDSHEDEELRIYRREAHTYIHWPRIGIKVKCPQWNDLSPEIRDIAPLNPRMVLHGQTGFSIGKYHEFFVTDLVHYRATLEIGQGIATIGSITPLAKQLYWASEIDHIHGEIEFWQTLRLQNINASDLEPTLLTALEAFSEQHKNPISISSLRINPEDFEFLEALDESKPPISPIPSVPADLTAQRLYYYGCRQQEHSAAFLQFYRILELYSKRFSTVALARLRRSHITDREFVNEASKLLNRREESSLCALIERLPNSAVLDLASSLNLISSRKPSALAQQLYLFRNSVVHAKEDDRAPLFVQSPLSEDSEAHNWQRIAQMLAKEAISMPPCLEEL